MLQSLVIKNYALINDIKVDFKEGLTIITGETGAGKSILLGALSLLLGKRADLSSSMDSSKKCIIEGQFSIKQYNLKGFFKNNDLDFEVDTIIRRELLPSGKSRAFINDTPVTLSVLSTLGSRLIDIHSQHETLQLLSDSFQFYILDSLANTSETLQEYKQILSELKNKETALEELILQKTELVRELDYNSFLLNELNEANLDSINEDELEAEYEILSNVETIQEQLSEAIEQITNEDIGLTNNLNNLQRTLANLKSSASIYENLWERINSVSIELGDIENELLQKGEGLEVNPEKLLQIETSLKQMHDLKIKHVVATIDELKHIKEQLSQKVSIAENSDELLKQTEFEIAKIKTTLSQKATQISAARKSIIPSFINELELRLVKLGLPNAKCKISLTKSDSFLVNGVDVLQFLFTANKGIGFTSIKKAASGGELSRIMLAIKSILSQNTKLPTLIFDEIDTGVSGEIANKVGDVMMQMGADMQLMCITHLPQIAAKGEHHIKVYKEDVGGVSTTKLKSLSEKERIVEIAQMLGGQNLSNSAMNHAKELLN